MVLIGVGDGTGLFLYGILAGFLLKKLLLLLPHLLLKDVDRGVVSCLGVARLRRVFMDEAQDGAPVLPILIACLPIEIE